MRDLVFGSCAALALREMEIAITHLFVSPGHNFFGRRELPAGNHPTQALESVRCRAGWGIEGDRFYGYRPDYAGQITFFSSEVFAALQSEFRSSALSPGVLRRNVVVAGADLNALIGWRFSIGSAQFLGTGEARPCHWMNHAVAPGAEEWLKGRGGLRARVIGDGELRTGPAELVLLEKGAQPRLASGLVGERAVQLRFEGGV